MNSHYLETNRSLCLTEFNRVFHLWLYCVSSVVVVGNFVVEKYRPRLAQIATFCCVEKGRKAHNVIGIRNYINFDSHPVYS